MSCLNIANLSCSAECIVLNDYVIYVNVTPKEAVTVSNNWLYDLWNNTAFIYDYTLLGENYIMWDNPEVEVKISCSFDSFCTSNFILVDDSCWITSEFDLVEVS